jgi:hypothetical protein
MATASRRYFGFEKSNEAGPSRSNTWGDEARNPVVRDSLVPIVVEQTVCLRSIMLIRFMN